MLRCTTVSALILTACRQIRSENLPSQTHTQQPADTGHVTLAAELISPINKNEHRVLVKVT